MPHEGMACLALSPLFIALIKSEDTNGFRD